jgi:hypothetical protein
MNEQIRAAEAIADWPSYGIQLSPELTDAIELWTTVRYFETSYVPEFDVETVTKENLGETIAELANAYLAQQEFTGLAGVTTLQEQARFRILVEQSAKVVRLGKAFTPQPIAQLRPSFTKHAAAYCDAVKQLPKDLSNDSLVQAGPDVLRQYNLAQVEARYLERCDQFLETLGFGHTNYKTASRLRLLTPRSYEQLRVIERAAEAPTNPARDQVNRVWLAAALAGIEFSLKTPRQADKLREQLELEYKQRATTKAAAKSISESYPAKPEATEPAAEPLPQTIEYAGKSAFFARSN